MNGDKAWLKFGVLGGAIFALLIPKMSGLHDFLAITSPTAAEVLVVEGWIWDRPAMEEVLPEFRRGNYRYLVCVGGPAGKNNAPISYAELAMARLVQLGVNAQSIRTLPVPGTEDQRTYRSALAVRDWARKEKLTITGVNVFTLGVHARKSRLLFQRALEPEFRTGIIAGTEHAYPPHAWWTSQLGRYLVMRNLIGYLHALCGEPLKLSNNEEEKK